MRQSPAASPAPPGPSAACWARRMPDDPSPAEAPHPDGGNFFAYEGACGLACPSLKLCRAGGGSRNLPPACAAAPRYAPARVRSFPAKQLRGYRHFWLHPPGTSLASQNRPVGKISRVNGGMRSYAWRAKLFCTGGGATRNPRPARTGTHAPKRPGCFACSAPRNLPRFSCILHALLTQARRLRARPAGAIPCGLPATPFAALSRRRKWFRPPVPLPACGAARRRGGYSPGPVSLRQAGFPAGSRAPGRLPAGCPPRVHACTCGRTGPRLPRCVRIQPHEPLCPAGRAGNKHAQRRGNARNNRRFGHENRSFPPRTAPRVRLARKSPRVLSCYPAGPRLSSGLVLFLRSCS